jgi:acyl carrier protein
MQLRDRIFVIFQEVAQEQGKILAPLSPSLGLSDTGLDSLCLAIIVARLEDRLGIDPFSAADGDTFPTTLGDFVRLYEAARPDAAG